MVQVTEVWVVLLPTEHVPSLAASRVWTPLKALADRRWAVAAGRMTAAVCRRSHVVDSGTTHTIVT